MSFVFKIYYHKGGRGVSLFQKGDKMTPTSLPKPLQQSLRHLKFLADLVYFIIQILQTNQPFINWLVELLQQSSHLK